MTYKALNTFIDDLFAFIVKQPMLYRLACFRDDIIFFATLYQRYIYGVDKTRAHEFSGAVEDTCAADEGNDQQQVSNGEATENHQTEVQS